MEKNEFLLGVKAFGDRHKLYKLVQEHKEDIKNKLSGKTAEEDLNKDLKLKKDLKQIWKSNLMQMRKKT
jgi:hypothetical protein